MTNSTKRAFVALLLGCNTIALAKDRAAYDRVLSRIYAAMESEGGIKRYKTALEAEGRTDPSSCVLYGRGLCASLISSEILTPEANAIVSDFEAALKKWPREARLRAAYAQCLIRFDWMFHSAKDGDPWARITRNPDGTRHVLYLGPSPIGIARANALTKEARSLAPKDPDVYMMSGALEQDPRQAYRFLSRAVELGGMEVSGFSLARALYKNGEKREDEVVMRKYGAWLKRFAAENPRSRRVASLKARGEFPD